MVFILMVGRRFLRYLFFEALSYKVNLLTGYNDYDKLEEKAGGL
jgi:hypothetical protein